MSRTIDLSPDALEIVRGILHRHLPSDARASVFGSRAAGTARRYSDLDLALEAPNPISEDILMTVREALSESDLPFKVDVLDLRAAEPRFRALIEADLVALPF